MEGKAKVENGNRIDRVIRREEAAELLGNSRAHAHQDEPAWYSSHGLPAGDVRFNHALAVADSALTYLDARGYEQQVRRLAHRHECRVIKSREWKYVPHCHNHGLYMLVNWNNWVLLGADFDATLEDIESFLNKQEGAAS